jgi:hypothetical protein
VAEQTLATEIHGRVADTLRISVEKTPCPTP